jgi:hypothetical protein
MAMRNLYRAGFALLVAGMLAFSACGSSDKTGTGGSSGSGGATGSGGSTTDAGSSDVPAGTGGSDGGNAGTGGASASAHQDHLNIINKATTGGMTVTRPAPVPYDTCRI